MAVYYGSAPGDPMPPAGGSTANLSSLQAKYGGTPSAGVPAGGSIPGLLAPEEPLVYMGTRPIPTYHPSTGEPLGTNDKAERILTITRALDKFDKMTFTEQRNMLRLLAIGGFAGSIDLEDIDEAVRQASQMEAREAYQALLETASDYYMNTRRAVTPNDVLRSAIAYRLGGLGIQWDGDLDAFNKGISKDILKAVADASGDSLYGEEPKPFTHTTTYKSVDLLNPQDAKSLTRSMLQQQLGRDPTQAEYEDFLSTLHAAERANPSVTTQTTKYVLDANGNLQVGNQTSRTQEGIGAEGLAQVAYEKAQSNPEWAEYQAMGYYFPALLSALGATVPGV